MMLNEIGKLLFGEKGEARNQVNSKVECFDKTEKSPVDKESNSVKEFLFSIKGIGSPEYPILDKKYSPSSRVPCTDLIPFISKCITEDDIAAIKITMRAVIGGNPGLGIGPDWMDNSVDNVLSIPFGDYVSFPSQTALPELKAMFIIAGKSGGGREFLITEEIPRLMSWVFIAHNPTWRPQMQTLAKRANSWIEKMAKDTPYWKGFGKFDCSRIQNAFIEDELRSIILNLTPAARMQLFHAVKTGGGPLTSLTNYQIRSLGINVNKTSIELIESGLLKSSSSNASVEAAHSKQELIELCVKNGADYRKSWKKERLVDALKEKDSNFVEDIARSKNLVAPNYDRYSGLRNIIKVAQEHQRQFALLCFA